MYSTKVYVPVKASFDADGRMLPIEIVWEDGRKYQIDKILDIRQAAAAKAGSGGDRYTVRIGGKESYLFFGRSTVRENCIGDGLWKSPFGSIAAYNGPTQRSNPTVYDCTPTTNTMNMCSVSRMPK